MFKVRHKYGGKQFTVYAVDITSTGRTKFLLYDGWHRWEWYDASDYEPVEEK